MARRPSPPKPSRREALALAAGAGLAFCVPRPSLAAADPAWIDQRRLGPFVCRATFPLERRLLEDADLEGLERELRRVLGLRPCACEIEVLLLRDAGQHREEIARRHPEAPYRRALFYKTSERSVVYAYRHAELAIDLRHEGTHALLHADLPMVPLWLDEGLAEYFEPRPERRAVGPGHLEGVLADVARGRVTPLESLEQKHDLAQLTSEDYRYAWAWVHLLLHGPPAASRELWGTLASLRRYEPPTPMSSRLNAALGPPTEALARHFRAWPALLEASGSGAGARR